MLRKKKNRAQIEAYSQSLQQVTNGRNGDFQNEEIKTLNLMRVIIEGGWLIDEQVLE